jgi:hypothetical protein
VTRIVLLIIGVVLVIVIGVFGFNLIAEWLDDSRLLTITAEGEIQPEELEVTNDEKVRVENKTNDYQTLQKAGSSEIITEVEANKRSEVLELEDDTEYELVLASKPDSRATLFVGEPESLAAAPTPQATPNPTSTSVAVNQSLPRTGRAEIEVGILLILLGLGLGRYASRLHPASY